MVQLRELLTLFILITTQLLSLRRIPFFIQKNYTTSQASQNYVSSEKLSSYIHYCHCSNNIHDIHGNESDHTGSKLAYTIVGIISPLVIRYLKLQAYTNSSPLSIASPTLLHAITFLTTTVTKRIYKDLNLPCRLILIFRTNVNENITSALRPAHRELGCNTTHSTSYLLALCLFYS